MSLITLVLLHQHGKHQLELMPDIPMQAEINELNRAPVSAGRVVAANQTN